MMNDSVIVMKVKNGYIVRPELTLVNREVYAFETFETLVAHLEMVFEIEDFFGDEGKAKTSDEVHFETT